MASVIIGVTVAKYFLFAKKKSLCYFLIVMQCVILAAGEGKRMRPLTLYQPKPMLTVLEKPILEHLLENLPPAIDEVIIVIGYLGDHIRRYFGSQFKTLKIRYVLEDEQLGTYHALLVSRSYLREDRFLILMADDFHGRIGLGKCLQNFRPAVLTVERNNPEILRRTGVAEIDRRGRIKSIEEKPEKPKSNLALTGVAVLDHRIFAYQPEPQKGEYFLSRAIHSLAQNHYVAAVLGTAWQPVGYPEDLAKAADFLKRNEHLR